MLTKHKERDRERGREPRTKEDATAQTKEAGAVGREGWRYCCTKALPFSINEVRLHIHTRGGQAIDSQQKNIHRTKNSPKTNNNTVIHKIHTSASLVCTPCSSPRIRWSFWISCAVRLATLCLASWSEAPWLCPPVRARLLLLLARPRSSLPSPASSAARAWV